MNEFRQHACWTREGVIEASFHTLGSRNTVKDALVQATRVELPIAGLGKEVKYTIGEIIDEFEGTFDDRTVNTTFAFVGDSGSGKTFLVRCALSRLESRSDSVVVYIPREQTSMKAILKLLLEQLPGDAARNALVEVESAAPDDLPIESALEVVYTQLRIAFQNGSNSIGRPQTPTEIDSIEMLLGSKEPGANIYRDGLADFLDLPKVKNHLLRENGVLWEHVQALRGVHGKDDLPSFSCSEFPSILAQDKRNNRNLRKFLDWITLEGTDNCALAADLLNGALNQALSAHIKMSRDLGDIVSESRRILYEEKKQLVLLFEDLARHGGVSHSIYNLFRDLPEEGKAPIRTIFAATTGFYRDKLESQIRTVSTAYVVPSLDGEKTDHQRLGREIIARYFNLARLGRARIESAWDDASEDSKSDGTWLPNACDECEFKATCHAEFGEASGMGTYPLNQEAANRSLGSISGDARAGISREFSPRDIVMNIVSSWLRESGTSIETGRFPTRDIERIVGNDVNEILQQNVLTDDELELHSDLKDRIHRTRVVWANSASSDKTYSDVVARAFGLPESGKVSEAGKAQLPTKPIIEPHERQFEVVDFITRFGDISSWSVENSNSVILDDNVSLLRQVLHRLTLSRLRLDRYFIKADDPRVKHLVDTILGESSFRFKDCYGDQPDNRRIQRELHRKSDTARIIFAVLWWNKTHTWANEYQDENFQYRINERELREGRRLLIDFVSGLADDVANRVQNEIADGVKLALRARLRALALENPSTEETDVLGIMKMLMSTDFRLLCANWRDSSFDASDSIAFLEGLVEVGLSARQGNGRTRYAEDVYSKIHVIEEFLQDVDSVKSTTGANPQLSVEVVASFNKWNQLLDQRLMKDSEDILNFVETFSSVEPDNLKATVNKLSALFEYLLPRQMVPLVKTAKQYRGILEKLDDDYEEIGQVLTDLGALGQQEFKGSSIWSICRRFPKMDEYSTSLTEILEIAGSIADHLDANIDKENPIDIGKIRDNLSESLGGLSSLLQSVGEDGK